jgi:hypothetical protein
MEEYTGFLQETLRRKILLKVYKRYKKQLLVSDMIKY